MIFKSIIEIFKFVGKIIIPVGWIFKKFESFGKDVQQSFNIEKKRIKINNYVSRKVKNSFNRNNEIN